MRLFRRPRSREKRQRSSRKPNVASGCPMKNSVLGYVINRWRGRGRRRSRTLRSRPRWTKLRLNCAALHRQRPRNLASSTPGNCGLWKSAWSRSTARSSKRRSKPRRPRHRNLYLHPQPPPRRKNKRQPSTRRSQLLWPPRMQSRERNTKPTSRKPSRAAGWRAR
ncbi:hypothetical protein EDB85DRAFT_2011732 [Lactarius pseudohatsudake]|nr:hypothetical protein EDB85DRAFT_2011732 [Lactarius pseudohatsudake]